MKGSFGLEVMCIRLDVWMEEEDSTIERNELLIELGEESHNSAYDKTDTNLNNIIPQSCEQKEL